MGWKNRVDFIQAGHEEMGRLAGVPASQKVQMGYILPQADLRSPRDWFSFYVDNFDQTKVVVQTQQGLYEGQPSDAQLRLREVYKVWGVDRDHNKSAEGVLDWTSLGAEQRGIEGLVGSALSFRHALLGGNLHMLNLEGSRVSGSAELMTTVSKNMHSVQFARPLGVIFDEVYRAIHCGPGHVLGVSAGDELLMLTMSLPMHWMDQRLKLDPKVYATDASEEGGGACVSYELSPLGEAKVHMLSCSAEDLDGQAADPILVIEHFGGMGGLKKALDLLGIVPMGVIFIDSLKTACKLAKLHCAFAITLNDATTITRDQVRQWRQWFPRATKVVSAGGWPSSSHLLETMLQVTEWLKELDWEVVELYENVMMNELDRDTVTAKIQAAPLLWDAAQLSPCKRARLFWLRPGPDTRN